MEIVYLYLHCIRKLGPPGSVATVLGPYSPSCPDMVVCVCVCSGFLVYFIVLLAVGGKWQPYDMWGAPWPRAS